MQLTSRRLGLLFLIKFNLPIVALLVGLFAAPPATQAEPFVVLATYDGVINPVSAEYLHDALAWAEEGGAQALIVALNTPGGLDTSMRLIIKDITGANIPVVVYVSPSSGRAASAGVFITMAAHVAAMAPGTNIGAAHPVNMGGGEMDNTMKEKVENDSVAYIKSIAQQRGRNAAWAEDAVRKSVSVTEREAVKLKVVDVVAEDLPALLKQLEGRSVNLPSGPIVLKTSAASVREFPMGFRLEWLKAISDPNIAYLLMTIGTIGIIAELYSPGAILPGIVGAISLILAFYSFQSLPVNYAGVLLFLLGIVFFLLEASVTSYGLLAIGGVISMLIGSVMLIKTDVEFFRISWLVILPVVTLAAVFALLIVGMGVKAMRKPPVTGREEMVGLVGIAKTALAPQGQLAVHGELWEAVSEQPLRPGDEAEVTGVEGLRLRVKPFSKKKEV
ncbi:MAG TPA: nodulation protein NfeD [Nitrospira sp.]|jgi:membrane-bound serine protease (ClpP class)|nr:nodulation protein NfeD [Nitrospira sp.]